MQPDLRKLPNRQDGTLDAATSDKKRILFVDDEPSILAGLQNVLFKDRKRWDMVFALGSHVALCELHKAPFDVVVSDMRMPDIDGATLLNVIKDESPATVRIMLSGQVNQEAISRALPALHQLLVKPCDVRTLRGTIERSLDPATFERDAKVCEIIGSVDKLPSPPDVYFALIRLLRSPNASTGDVADVVARDPGLASKVLQLANGAYFGTGHKTASIPQAVSLLGTECLRYLALTASVFSSEADTGGVSLCDLQEHAMQTARLARAFADGEARDEAFATGLLHDVGHVVLALGQSTEFGPRGRPWKLPEGTEALERESLGVTHADIGARLLAIWGLPQSIVDGVQFHHDPGSGPEACRQLSAIVHVADALARSGTTSPQLNWESLDRAGCGDRVASWLAIAARET